MKTRLIPAPKNWKSLKLHPLSALVPYGAGIDTAKLAESMRLHGYDSNEPIVLFDGQVLDGRHRLVAAQEADVVPTFVELLEGDLVAFCMKKLNRQHLDESQRAQLAAALIKAGSESEGANLPLTQRAAAELVNVSVRSVKDAVKVTNEGSEELKQEVLNGTVAVSDAADSIRFGRCFVRAAGASARGRTAQRVLT